MFGVSERPRVRCRSIKKFLIVAERLRGTYVSTEHMRVHFDRPEQSPLSLLREQIVNALFLPALVSTSGKLRNSTLTLHST
jgi:hypothetical protein